MLITTSDTQNEPARIPRCEHALEVFIGDIALAGWLEALSCVSGGDCHDCRVRVERALRHAFAVQVGAVPWTVERFSADASHISDVVDIDDLDLAVNVIEMAHRIVWA